MSGVEVLFQTTGAGTLSTRKSRPAPMVKRHNAQSLKDTECLYHVYGLRHCDRCGRLNPQFTAIARKPVLSRLEIATRNPQTAYVGKRLKNPLEVRVLDTDEDPVEDFQHRSRSAVLSDTSTVTQHAPSGVGTSGYGVTLLRVPVASGCQGEPRRVFPVISCSPHRGSPVADLVKVSGDNQSGKPGGQTQEPFRRGSLKSDENPFEGIKWRSKSLAGGKLSATSRAITDSSWTRTDPYARQGTGENTVKPAHTEVSGTVTFSALAGAEVVMAAGKPRTRSCTG